MVDVQGDPVELAASRYDAWREAYGAERERVLAALADADLGGEVERVEHVGSTAVPDLAAKDVVDLDVVVADDAVSAVARAVEAALGGTRYENSDAWQPVFREHGGQRFNVHVFASSSPRWRVSVATRAVLRADPELRAEYESLKRRLAAEHDDVNDYSRGKTAFVGDLLAAARERDLGLDFAVPADW